MKTLINVNKRILNRTNKATLRTFVSEYLNEFLEY
jgi:hypothetical protein